MLNDGFGRVEGRFESLRHSLITVYRARFGEEPPDLVAALKAARSKALERWLPLFATGTRDDIARAVQTE